MGSRVNFKGPIFSVPARRAAMNSMRHGIMRAVTEFAFAAVQGILANSLKNPTPIYQTTIIIDNRLDDRWEVTDQNAVVYNRWLEGTGSRNYPATRFRGYHAFQRAYEMTQRQSSSLAQVEIGRTVRKLGG